MLLDPPVQPYLTAFEDEVRRAARSRLQRALAWLDRVEQTLAGPPVDAWLNDDPVTYRDTIGGIPAVRLVAAQLVAIGRALQTPPRSRLDDSWFAALGALRESRLSTMPLVRAATRNGDVGATLDLARATNPSRILVDTVQRLRRDIDALHSLLDRRMIGARQLQAPTNEVLRWLWALYPSPALNAVHAHIRRNTAEVAMLPQWRVDLLVEHLPRAAYTFAVEIDGLRELIDPFDAATGTEHLADAYVDANLTAPPPHSANWPDRPDIDIVADPALFLDIRRDALAELRQSERDARPVRLEFPPVPDVLDGLADKKHGRGVGWEVTYRFPAGWSAVRREHAARAVGTRLAADDVRLIENPTQEDHAAARERGYSDRWWSYESDYGVDAEIVSPVFYGARIPNAGNRPPSLDDTWHQVGTLFRILREASAEADIFWGSGHIHIGVGSWGHRDRFRRTLAYLVKKYEDVLMRLGQNPVALGHHGTAVLNVPSSGFTDHAHLRRWLRRQGRDVMVNFRENSRNHTRTDHIEFRCLDAHLDPVCG